MQKEDIKNYTLDELEKAIAGLCERPYKARQVYSWLYRRMAQTFEGMTDISKGLKDKLGASYYIGFIKPETCLKSKDGSEKALFKLNDGNFTETVLIPSGRRMTLCLSSQVGCKFSCSFCASGQKGFKRNLTPSEIISQVLFFKTKKNEALTNYCLMGMGEPLDNYDNVVKSIKIMNEISGLGIGARRITISTCGVVPGIEKLKDLGLQINLSVSLHAVNNELRNRLMPINRVYPLEKLIASCVSYFEKTKRIVTLEYVLIKGVNDSDSDAQGLAEIAKKIKGKINLIPYSPVLGPDYEAPSDKRIKAFSTVLLKRKANCTIRKSKGADISAACGQLAPLEMRKSSIKPAI